MVETLLIVTAPGARGAERLALGNYVPGVSACQKGVRNCRADVRDEKRLLRLQSNKRCVSDADRCRLDGATSKRRRFCPSTNGPLGTAEDPTFAQPAAPPLTPSRSLPCLLQPGRSGPSVVGPD